MTATQANGSATANAIDPLAFEAERARYISGISQLFRDRKSDHCDFVCIHFYHYYYYRHCHYDNDNYDDCINNNYKDVAQLITNVNVLNKNLETIINIGHEFEQLSQLWRHFHTSTLAFQDTASNESKQ
ncbi:hypothetical protein BG011_010064 [Mortierella polycephala]|uniref:DASH complex subunit DAD1 n=1 Tax=Mortierella polycephala TaxID=41804 RepID=A0A9P6PMD5_9FUNG|nr:hypothetical protein BG011_010064 [Mortierella polycephala]